jgi:uncharacterized membrane protein YfcA
VLARNAAIAVAAIAALAGSAAGARWQARIPAPHEVLPTALAALGLLLVVLVLLAARRLVRASGQRP